MKELANIEKPQQSTALAVANTSAEIAEVQASMVIAKNFPRSSTDAYVRILEECKRVKLAETAVYAYPRGGKTVTGPSIRLAEVLARNWGNIDSGFKVVSATKKASEVIAFAWDKETNTRFSIGFTVKHWRDTKAGGYQLTDERDIYELVANMSSRRMRACILRLIPGDIQDEAIDACNQTLNGAFGDSSEVVARKLVAAFKDLGVTQSIIEKRIGHNIESISNAEIVSLRQIYTSIKEGAAKKEQFFDYGKAKPTTDATKKAEDMLSVPATSKQIKELRTYVDAPIVDDLATELLDSWISEAVDGFKSINRDNAKLLLDALSELSKS